MVGLVELQRSKPLQERTTETWGLLRKPRLRKRGLEGVLSEVAVKGMMIKEGDDDEGVEWSERRREGRV